MNFGSHRQPVTEQRGHWNRQVLSSAEDLESTVVSIGKTHAHIAPFEFSRTPRRRSVSRPRGKIYRPAKGVTRVFVSDFESNSHAVLASLVARRFSNFFPLLFYSSGIVTVENKNQAVILNEAIHSNSC